MSDLQFSVDIESENTAATFLSGLQKQMPFVQAVAINRTAEEVLAEGRREIQANFIVRVPAFDLPPTQLPSAWRATASRAIATVNLGDGDGGRQGIGARRRSIFTKFEYGDPKVARDPAFPIAIPTTALRSSPTAIVPRAMYPANLRLSPRTTASGSTLAALSKGKVRTLSGGMVRSKKQRRELGLQGIGGTFTMANADGKVLGVFQRTGPGLRGYRMIWAFRQQINIPRRMDFAARGTAIINARFLVNLDGALALAIRTIK